MNRSQYSQLFTISFFILIPFIGLSQTEEASEKRFSIGLNFSPDYCYRTLNFAEKYKEYEEWRNEEDEAMFGFHTGIAFKYEASKKVELEVGLQYAQHNVLNNESYISVLDSKLYPLLIEEKSEYIKLPTKVNYQFLRKDWFMYVSGGISFDILLSYTYESRQASLNGETIYTAGNYEQDTMGERFNLSANLGFGVGYKINNKIEVRMEPVFRYAILHHVRNTDYSFNQYTFGLQTGIYYSF